MTNYQVQTLSSYETENCLCQLDRVCHRFLFSVELNSRKMSRAQCRPTVFTGFEQQLIKRVIEIHVHCCLAFITHPTDLDFLIDTIGK